MEVMIKLKVMTMLLTERTMKFMEVTIKLPEILMVNIKKIKRNPNIKLRKRILLTPKKRKKILLTPLRKRKKNLNIKLLRKLTQQ